MKLLEASWCTGCAACVNICKKNAINMSIDTDGFGYPVIDENKCIKCEKCVKVCEMRKKWPKDYLSSPAVYAMRSKNDDIRLHSTSGGVFSELAKCILKHKGCVVGATYAADWSVEHCMIQDINDLEQLRRSKYQQSNISYIYRKVKETLENKKEVLFCGTPCQVAGLKAFLGKEYGRLFACDFICRGVSSPKVFAEYINYLKGVYHSDVEYIWMKNKCNGWHNLTTVIKFKNGKKYVKAGLEDSYVQLYLKYNVGVRDSCYKCQFKGGEDVADITLGDFWGLEDTMLDDNLGTSVVIGRTEKGNKLINEMKGQMIYREMRLEDVEKGNPCLMNSIKRNIGNAEIFYDILEKEGYIQAVKWMTGV